VEATDFTKLARGNHHSALGKQTTLNVKVGDLVWLRVDRVKRPLEAPYEGPLEVIATNHCTVTVRYPSGRLSTVSKERVKIANVVRKDIPFRPTPQSKDGEDPPQPEQTSAPTQDGKRVTFALPEARRHHPYSLRPRHHT